MFSDSAIIEKVFAKIDRDEVIGLVMALCDFNSLTGREQEIANFVLNWFHSNGFHTIQQEVESSRCNAIGIVKGTRSGHSLTINGHLDIGFSTLPLNKSYAKDGLIFGREIGNMRAGLASFMMAGKAIIDSGIKLDGDLILATVVGEISSAPVGQFQGPQDRGEGLGTRYLLTHGIQSDFAVVADGSDFSVIQAQPGVADFRITTKGEVLFVPYTKRTEDPYKSQNAIIKMTKIIEVIENWARDFERRTIYEFPRGRVEPKVIISAIQAGIPGLTEDGWRLPFRPSRTPADCELYLDVRLSPGITPVQVKHELERLLSGLPLDFEIEMFQSQNGFHATGDEIDHLYSVVEKAYEYVFNAKPPPPTPSFCSMWTDTNVYWEMGIPTVKWGPSRRGATAMDRNAIEEEVLVQAAKVYTLIALEICGGRSS